MEADEAPEALKSLATAARNVAAGLNKFVNQVAPEDATDIELLISKCFELSSELRRLATVIERLPRRYRNRFEDIRDGLEDLDQSLNLTFNDVQGIVGEGFVDAERHRHSVPAQYRRVWEDLTAHFFDQSGNTLHKRLEYCRCCVVELKNILQEGGPHDPAAFHDLAGRVERLLKLQQRNMMIEGGDHLAPEQPGIPKPPSFERQRPTDGQIHDQPVLRDRNQALRTQPRMEPGWIPPPPPPPPRWHPPAAPEIPRSPISIDDYSNSSSSAQSEVGSHWLPRVFSRPPPYTALEATGERSACIAPDQPGALDQLDNDGYVSLGDMRFENGDVVVSFYHRFSDITTRLCCQTLAPRHAVKECTVPLYLLDIERVGPFLKLKRLPTRQRLGMLWACLRFMNYEILATFHCILLALRSQDQGGPGKRRDGITDYKLRYEDPIFRCVIPDDHYNHILEIRKDSDSGAVRLLASVAGDEMKRTPVWTAFITHQIHSPSWMRHTSSRVVQLADVQQYIFSNDYVSRTANSGHEVTFYKAKDAIAFMDAIDDLVEEAKEAKVKAKGKGKEKEKEKGKGKKR